MQHPPPPFKHQADALVASKDREFFALFWEMGCAKSRVVIDTAAHLYRKGEINALIIVAPNTVHRNWVVNELPFHTPRDVAKDVKIHLWESSRAAKPPRKGQKFNDHMQECGVVLRHVGLSVLSISYDSLLTEKATKAIKMFFKHREVLLVADESQYIKTPDSRRTKRMQAMSEKAKYRRILSGTPILNDARDAFAQLRFLDKEIWEQIGGRNFAAFKNYFCTFETQTLRTGRSFQRLTGFRNRGRLGQIVESCSSRLLKDDVLDLPPKLYTTRYFTLGVKQRRLYRDVENNFYALHDGAIITTELAIVRDIRLQQITSGYIVVDDDDEPRKVADDNPRIDTLMHVLGDHEGKAIIWAKYRMDIDQIMKAIGDTFGANSVVRLDGSVKSADRMKAVQSLQEDDECRFFVGNAQAAGTGLTLTAATLVVYYNNSFKYGDRRQSEDRAHRPGQTKSVLYVDICAVDTVDEKIVKALREKNDTAIDILGDPQKPWI